MSEAVSMSAACNDSDSPAPGCANLLQHARQLLASRGLAHDDAPGLRFRFQCDASPFTGPGDLLGRDGGPAHVVESFVETCHDDVHHLLVSNKMWLRSRSGQHGGQTWSLDCGGPASDNDLVTYTRIASTSEIIRRINETLGLDLVEEDELVLRFPCPLAICHAVRVTRDDWRDSNGRVYLEQVQLAPTTFYTLATYCTREDVSVEPCSARRTNQNVMCKSHAALFRHHEQFLRMHVDLRSEVPKFVSHSDTTFKGAFDAHPGSADDE